MLKHKVRLIGIIIILLAIPVTVLLSQQVQNFLNFAASPDRKMVLGISMIEGYHSKDANTSTIISTIDRINRSVSQGGVGQYPGMFSIWTNFGDLARPGNPNGEPRTTFPSKQLLDAFDKRHITPMIFMQPVRPASQGKITNQSIADGAYDSYLRQWANDAKAYGKPVILRFAHEMNGYWYDWSPGNNGSTPSNYVAMWRHVYNVIHPIAPNVKFFWCPIHTSDSGNTYRNGKIYSNLKEFYPGDKYVDYVGFDGYKFSSKPKDTTKSFFGETIRAIRNVVKSDKPIIIGETGVNAGISSSERRAWVNGYVDVYREYPGVVAISYFNIDMRDRGEPNDWRFSASPQIRTAYADIAKQSRFKGRFSPWSGPPVFTSTKTIYPYMDAFVRSSEPSKNFASASSLYTGSNPTDIIYFKFDLSSLSGKKISKATLVLTVSQPSNTTQSLKLASSNSWSEKSINYNNRPTGLSTISTFTPKTAGEKLNLNILSSVNKRKGQAMTIALTSGGSARNIIWSKEAASANRPQLVVEYR